jgi:hypothetical protein
MRERSLGVEAASEDAGTDRQPIIGESMEERSLCLGEALADAVGDDGETVTTGNPSGRAKTSPETSANCQKPLSARSESSVCNTVLLHTGGSTLKATRGERPANRRAGCYTNLLHSRGVGLVRPEVGRSRPQVEQIA